VGCAECEVDQNQQKVGYIDIRLRRLIALLMWTADFWVEVIRMETVLELPFSFEGF